MKPLATALNILHGKVDTFMGSLLSTIVYLTECMEKKQEKLKESERLAFIPLTLEALNYFPTYKDGCGHF